MPRLKIPLSESQSVFLSNNLYSTSLQCTKVIDKFLLNESKWDTSTVLCTL